MRYISPKEFGQKEFCREDAEQHRGSQGVWTGPRNSQQKMPVYMQHVSMNMI